MSRIFDIASQAQESRDAEQKLIREKELEKTDRAKEKELERIDRQKETRSDRRFQVILLVVGVVVGIMGTKIADYFFN